VCRANAHAFDVPRQSDTEQGNRRATIHGSGGSNRSFQKYITCASCYINEAGLVCQWNDHKEPSAVSVPKCRPKSPATGVEINQRRFYPVAHLAKGTGSKVEGGVVGRGKLDGN
jgi:hypothetical protein